MLDLRVHVWPHQPGTPTPTFDQLEQYCEAAGARGISQIAITEHSTRFARILDQVIPHWHRPTTGAAAAATAHVLEAGGAADLDAYVTALDDAQRAGLPILIGLEVDYLPGAMPAMAEVLSDYPFDVLLGSVHWLDEWLFDAYETEAFVAQWEDRDVDEVFSQYVDSVLDLADSGVVDVLARLDVIKVAGHRATRLGEHEHRLVEGLSNTNLAIEFSSAGLRKPVADTYPSRHFSTRFSMLGCRSPPRQTHTLSNRSGLASIDSSRCWIQEESRLSSHSADAARSLTAADRRLPAASASATQCVADRPTGTSHCLFVHRSDSAGQRGLGHSVQPIAVDDRGFFQAGLVVVELHLCR